MTDYFFQIFFMGTSCVALSIKNIKNSSEQRNDVTKKMGGGGGGRCQALVCGRARYLPSLIALFVKIESNNLPGQRHVMRPKSM